MPSSPIHPPLPPNLLLLVHGLGEESVTAFRASARALPIAIGEDPIGLLARSGDAAAELRELGVAVDRSGLLLRPVTACDETALLALGRRATGMAAASVLELRSVLQAGLAAGMSAVPAALDGLARLVEHARELGGGTAVETWIIGLGELQPVASTFDLTAALRRSRAGLLGDQLRLDVGPAAARIRTTTTAARDIVVDVLHTARFRERGELVDGWRDGLRFAARPQVAFGNRRLTARPPLPHEARGVALLPRAPRAAETALDLRGVVARFWMRAAEHADLRTEIHARPAPAPVSIDDAASLIDAESTAPPTTVDELRPR